MAGGLIMANGIQLYCDIDEQGNITRLLSGEKVIPTSSFQHFFMIDKKTEVNLSKFYVKDGNLEQKEGTVLIEVEPQLLSEKEQLELMQKRMEEMEKLLATLSNS